MTRKRTTTNQLELFVMAFVDPSPKDDRFSMEHPLFSLQKKPDMDVVTYKRGEVEYEIAPSYLGRATIWDKKILLFCAAQIMQAINEGREVNKRVVLPVYQYLKVTGGTDSKNAYDEVEKRLNRLKGTQITSRGKWPGEVDENGARRVPDKRRKGFGFIQEFEIIERDGTGRFGEVEILLTDWFYNTIREKAVLTINREFFKLTASIEMRIYEIARKFCGEQPKWEIGLEKLYPMIGTKDTVRKLRMRIRKGISALDYAISLDPDRDVVIVRNTKGAVQLEEEPA